MDQLTAARPKRLPILHPKGATCAFKLPHFGMYRVVNEYRQAAGIAPLPFALTKVRITSNIPPIANIFSSDNGGEDRPSAVGLSSFRVPEAEGPEQNSVSPCSQNFAQVSIIRKISFGPRFTAPKQKTAIYPDTLLGVTYPCDTASVSALEDLVSSRRAIEADLEPFESIFEPELKLALSA